ncbi:VOC family protein [Kineosporia succinea]|uniref:PhnB protein n=1 Tax=Kineosporia succinea TaxID=84632 RepID=A0ABT9NXN6_9ACTN|nr:VOC family protein [Kineosporia succinea]MDP9825032.1 PhnB protein [Kineosporia succinea]
MSVVTTVHLNFRGQARAALEFYQSVFGGHLTLVTHAQSYGTTDPAEVDLIGWGQVQSERGFHVMAYDVPAARAYEPGIDPLFVSLRGDDETELRGYWDALAKDATIKAPLEPSGWSPLYGMLTDAFGVTWVLDIAVAYNG